MSMDGLNLAHLTETERDQIIGVIQRDEKLQLREDSRVRKLKAEIKFLRMKGVIKAGIDPDKTCARCREPLGLFFNRGELCPQCHSKVCKKCKDITKENQSWLCVLCCKQMELQAMSGQWFYSKFRKSKRHRKSQKVITGTEMVRHSMKKPLSNGSGTQGAASEVKRALLQNTSYRPHPPFHLPATDTESSDGHEGKKKRRAAKGQAGVAFPNDDDQKRLAELVTGRAEVNVRRVQVKRYDTDSSSSEEEYHPPRVPFSTGHNANHAFLKLSGSPSSDRTVSPPDMRGSDMEVYSAQSSATESSRFVESPRHSMTDDVYGNKIGDANIPHLVDKTNYHSNNDRITGAKPTKRALEYHPPNSPPYSPRGRVSPSHFSVSESSNQNLPVQEEVIVPTQVQKKEVEIASFEALEKVKQQQTSEDNRVSNQNSSPSKHELSFTSGEESEGEYEMEQLTKIRFRRCSVQKMDPDSPEQENTNPAVKIIVTGEDVLDQLDEGLQSPISSISSSEYQTPDGKYRYRDGRDRVTFAPDTKPEADQHQHYSVAVSSKEIPKPAIVPKSVAIPDKPREEMHEDDEGHLDDNIDELVAQHRNSITSCDTGSLQRSNLLSPFSDSRESLTSYYSNAGEGNYGRIDVTGEIQFGLDYVYKTGVFEVRVKGCKDLAPVDTKRKRSDPYVKTYLLPDKTRHGKRKTRVKKHTLNPTFDETIKYFMTKGELETRTLWITVWHNDTFGRNDFLGEVTIPLDYYRFGDPTPHWYPLKSRNPIPLSLLTYKGDLILSIKYITPDKAEEEMPGKGVLHVLVKEARNLTAVRANGSSDPFCKGYLLPEKNKAAKQKSSVVKKDCSPKWNHTFVFTNVSRDELRNRCLELTIWDHDRFTSNDFLGGVRLNLGTGKTQEQAVEWMDARGEELSMWQSMLDRPNYWIAGSMLLRANMDMRQ